MLKFTEGGSSRLWLVHRRIHRRDLLRPPSRLSWLQLGDVIVPCMFIGLAFGRIGCLMNGCCYGGRCDEGGFALHFPPSSPVYQDQIRSGELLGFRYDETTRESSRLFQVRWLMRRESKLAQSWNPWRTTSRL